jgi:hypothetical protein
VRLRVSLSAAAAIVLAASVVAGQGSFRLNYAVDRSSPSQAAVSGTVYNEGRSDALDVVVTAEAVDAEGRVLATGVTYVGLVPERGAARFTSKVPVSGPVRTFRVRVTSFRYGFASQSP